jgi:hypothetical protein
MVNWASKPLKVYSDHFMQKTKLQWSFPSAGQNLYPSIFQTTRRISNMPASARLASVRFEALPILNILRVSLQPAMQYIGSVRSHFPLPPTTAILRRCATECGVSEPLRGTIMGTSRHMRG